MGQIEIQSSLSAKKEKDDKDVQNGKDVSPSGFPATCLHSLSGVLC